VDTKVILACHQRLVKRAKMAAQAGRVVKSHGQAAATG
jgi:hypothetical protein